MKRTLLLIILGVTGIGWATAQQYEREEWIDGRHLLTLSETDPPLFKVKGFECDGATGGTRIVLKDIQNIPELAASVQSGMLQAEDAQEVPQNVWLVRECTCKDGSVFAVNLNWDCQECASACDGHDGPGETRYYLLVCQAVGGGLELGLGIDPQILVLIE
ncbi:MAG: hypothetical protein KA419_20905 [Acidobacteria bacterium]|nr:hypothetical protein [Acidobacteriota bacterium]